jgi:hypothetical protein
VTCRLGRGLGRTGLGLGLGATPAGAGSPLRFRRRPLVALWELGFGTWPLGGGWRWLTFDWVLTANKGWRASCALRAARRHGKGTESGYGYAVGTPCSVHVPEESH